MPIRLIVRLLLVLLAALAVAGCAIGRASPATDVTSSGATLRGAVDSDRAQTIDWWFEYGTTAAYDSETPRRQLTFGGRSRTRSRSDLGARARHDLPLPAVRAGPDADAGCGKERTSRPAQAQPTELWISGSPALYPSFDPEVGDYVTRCTQDPVEVDVEAPAGTQVAVDERTARTGRFTETVQLAEGQAFDITTTGGTTSTHHVRCLPADFPAWTYGRTGTPSQAFTLVSVVVGVSSAQYVVFFDGRGVPVWWYQPAEGFSRLTPSCCRTTASAFAEWGLGSFTANPALKYQVRRLDGSLVRTCRPSACPPTSTSCRSWPNGNFVLVAYKPRDHVDLSAYGKSSDATVLDAEIQEITPQGARVWSWNSKDHIALDETGRWWNTLDPAPLPDGRQATTRTHQRGGARRRRPARLAAPHGRDLPHQPRRRACGVEARRHAHPAEPRRGRRSSSPRRPSAASTTSADSPTGP